MKSPQIQPGSADASPSVSQPADSRSTKTPNADMQAEDTGSDAGIAGEEDPSGTAATRAMKQTSKTDSETGNRR